MEFGPNIVFCIKFEQEISKIPVDVAKEYAGNKSKIIDNLVSLEICL